MKLSDYRAAKGLTQQQVARALLISASAVCRYEAGSKIPEPKIMRRIVSWSGGKVEPNDFYFETAKS